MHHRCGGGGDFLALLALMVVLDQQDRLDQPKAESKTEKVRSDMCGLADDWDDCDVGLDLQRQETRRFQLSCATSRFPCCVSNHDVF